MPDPQTPPQATPKPSKPAAADIRTHASQRVDRGKARRPMLEWFFYALGLGAMVVLVAGPFIKAAVENDLAQAASHRGTYVSIIILSFWLRCY